jgi:flagellar motor switch protein FliN/FliY
MTLLSQLAHLSPELFKLDAVPLFGTLSPFPVEAFAKKISDKLKIGNLTIEASVPKWIEGDKRTSGLGSKFSLFELSSASLKGALFVFISDGEQKSLFKALVPIDSSVIDPEYQEGITPFLLFEALSTLKELGWPEGIAFAASEIEHLPDEPLLSQDVTFSFQGKTFSLRIAFSKTLQEFLQTMGAQKEFKHLIDASRADQFDVTAHLEIARIPLTLAEWKGCAPGDFLLLPAGSFDADGEKSKVLLTIEGRPLFRAKIKEGNLKILEHPLAYEETEMNREENTEEEFEEVEAEDIDEAEEETEGGEEEEEAPVQKKAVPAKKVETKKPITPEEMLLPLVVEAGRIKIKLKTLMELEPGNVLELDLHPERGVDLVVNGNLIGRGELLKIGEAIGVRILEIA